MCDTERLLASDRRSLGWKWRLFLRGRSLFKPVYNLFDSSNPMKKPPSLPNNWPNCSPVDLEVKPKRIIKIGCDQLFYFNGNVVKTSKYEVYNFLPKFLLEEFNPVSLSLIPTDIIVD